MTTSKRQAQKLETKRHLIEVAFNLFSRNGLLATRTLDLALEAGVSHGTVFVHFPTKEDLLVTIIQEFGNRIAGRIHELAGGGSSVREVLAAHLNGLQEYESFYIRLVKEGHLLPAEARNILVMIQSAISFHLSLATERELAAGKIRQIPLHLLFNTWIGLIHYYLGNNDLFAPGSSVLAAHGEELLEHYLALITL